MRVAILGFGLIGGSVARALSARAGDGQPETWEIAAWSPSGAGPRKAFANGEIAVAADDPVRAVDGAELVVLAAPPLDCLELLRELGGFPRKDMAPDAVVTDVASTKGRLVRLAGELGIRFVGGHPMAGLERSGFDAADPELFLERHWVICTDGADEAAILRVEALATSVGARPVRMDAATHDAAVAAISHLPLVLSVALVESVFGKATGLGDEDVRAAATRLAASGWRDMTRLARGDAVMAAGIAATNAEELGARIRALRVVLDEWLELIDAHEAHGEQGPEALAARFEATRRLLTDNERSEGA
jgi:prephenate dehydrogenase